MTVQELKIGNFVKVGNVAGEVVAIENDQDNTISVKIANSIIKSKLADIEPVPLERNMLIKCCGFDKSGKLKLDISDRVFYIYEKEGHIILMDKENIPLVHFWEIKTLHQLQRLYYALSGRDLPIIEQLHIT